MRGKRGQAGWYHDSTVGHFGGIFYAEDGEKVDTDVWGPFATFADAKRDALAYHQCDIDGARNAQREIRAFRKPRKEK